jgi:NADP-dependent 3-hydroxy acid dehydrogenase YdfG
VESSFAVQPRFQTALVRHIIHHRLGFVTWSWTMSILVTGSTGTIGSQVVQRLTGQSERIRALVRDDASKVKVPTGVEPVQADMTDVASMRRC